MASKCFTYDVFHFYGPLLGKGVFKIRENLKFIDLSLQLSNGAGNKNVCIKYIVLNRLLGIK